MKNKLNFTIVFFTIFGIVSYGQIKSNQSVANASINTSSLFLDASASTINNGSSVGSTNLGKGLAFPRVDLSVLILTNAGSYLSSNNPNKFDGTVVYNTVTSATTASGISIAVTPGFYYFSNPNKSLPNVTTALGGTWTALGSGSVKNIGTSEIATSTSIDGKQVYALTGTFTADTAPTVLVPNPTYVSTAVVSITKPTGFTGYFKMTTYTEVLGVKKTFRSDVSSLTVDPLDATKLILVTGNGLFSEVYPGGTYTYILEFFKA
jgi:hypothetical protein